MAKNLERTNMFGLNVSGPASYYRSANKVLEKLIWKGRHLTSHDFRTSCINHLVKDLKIPNATVSIMVGHKDPKTLSNYLTMDEVEAQQAAHHLLQANKKTALKAQAKAGVKPQTPQAKETPPAKEEDAEALASNKKRLKRSPTEEKKATEEKNPAANEATAKATVDR